MSNSTALSDVAMMVIMSKIHFVEGGNAMDLEAIIEKWVRAARANSESDDLEVGEDISPYPQVKIAFDGYAEDDDGDEDRSSESYAVYVHKDALSDDFIFPEHEDAFWAIVHRPSEEVHLNVWYDLNQDGCDVQSVAEAVADTELHYEQIAAVIQGLDKQLS